MLCNTVRVTIRDGLRGLITQNLIPLGAGKKTYRLEKYANY